MKKQDVTEAASDNPSGSIGNRLRYEREKRNLTQQDIANRLCLSIDIITALEEDRLEDLPDKVYVRGYQRRYCKELNIDPDNVIEVPESEVEEVEEEISADSQNRHYHHIIRVWGTMAVVAITVTLLAVQWIESGKNLPETPYTEGAGQDDPYPAGADNLFDDANEAEEDAEVFGELMPSIGEDELESDSDLLTEESEGILPRLLETNNEDATNNSELFPDSPAEEISLTISSNGKCWTRITDGKDAVLLNGILSEGYRNTIISTPPLEIQLGNAAVVEILINGEPYDITPYIGRLGTAFFKISSSGEQ